MTETTETMLDALLELPEGERIAIADLLYENLWSIRNGARRDRKCSSCSRQPSAWVIGVVASDAT